MSKSNHLERSAPLRDIHPVAEDEATRNIKYISGLVTRVVDGNTFIMSVLKDPDVGSNERYDQMIKIHGSNKPMTSTLPGILAKLDLEKLIIGRLLECEICDADNNDGLITVLISPPPLSIKPI